MNAKHRRPAERPGSSNASLAAEAGRVTPCAPPPADTVSNGAHGVTRPTLLIHIVVFVLMATLPVKAGGGLQKAEAIAATVDAAESSDDKQKVVIEVTEKEGRKKEVAWLGVSVQEASDALASQLGLNSGEGLVVTYLVPGSPAAKAGLQKNDVLAQFDDQILVHPGQFRKLVRIHKEGDTIKLIIYRHGKKDTISATLGKTVTGAELMPHESPVAGTMPGLNREIKEHIRQGLHEQLKNLHESLDRAGVDKEKLQIEISRGLEHVHEAVQEAMRHLPDPRRDLAPVIKDLERAIRSHVDVGDDASVTVKSRGNSVKTIVKSNDSGTYVVVANPRKRLTVHDKEGKLVFDGEIETPEQQEKVPAEVWEKVKPMLEQMNSNRVEDPDREEDKKPSF